MVEFSAKTAAPAKQADDAINAILNGWTGKDPEDLHAAAFAVGQLVGSGAIPWAKADSRLRTAAEVRGYECQDAAAARTNALLAGMACPRPIGEVRSFNAAKPSTAAPALPAVEDDSIDGDSLMRKDFPPLRFVIPGYLVEGLTVLGGKPKLGKSWLAYDWSVAVATGEKAMAEVDVEAGDVLYLALEDNHRRVKDRLNVVRPLSRQLGGLSRLSVRTRAPRIDTGLIEEIEKWRLAKDNPRLVIVDVYMKVRPPRKRGEDVYAADYAAVIPLQQYASEKRLSVVLVTHTRKAEAEDPLESISGTNGVTGAADAVMVLTRGPKGTTLYRRGRDIEEIDTAMKFDAGRWSILGDADEVRKSRERQKVIATLKEAREPITPKQIADATGIKAANLRVLLRSMLAAGELLQPSYGFYQHPR